MMASKYPGMVLYEGKLVILKSLTIDALIFQISRGPSWLFGKPDMYSFDLRVLELQRRIFLGIVKVPKHPNMRKVFFIHGIGLDQAIYDELEQHELKVEGTLDHCCFLFRHWYIKRHETTRAFTLLVDRNMRVFPKCLIPHVVSYL